jgi:hypothetical protein
MTIKGRILSHQLGEIGVGGMRYGFLNIETDGGLISVKVDAYTQHETLDIGERVIVEVETLGDTDILVAESVVRAPIFDHAQTVKTGPSEATTR